MLSSLLEAVTEGLRRRNLDFTQVAKLVGQAKEIHYSTVRIPENVLQIEEALEDDGVYDLLIILRSYLILHSQWELSTDWWTIVDDIRNATGIVCGTVTVNKDSKSSYYRGAQTTAKMYNPPSHGEGSSMSNDLWRNNDWLAVLWLLSHTDLNSLTDIKP